MKTPKQKLKPSWEMHDRILWDPKLNSLAFYIGYEDRMIKNAFGEKLLIAAQEYAKANNLKGLTLETASDNPAQKLYERLGWSKDESYHYFWKA